MAKRLEGKTVLITGASSGIGYSTAKEFARTSPANLKLIVTARRLPALQKLQEEIRTEVGDGVKVLPVQLDVSKPEEITKFVKGLPEEFKDVDVLVNNALVELPFSLFVFFFSRQLGSCDCLIQYPSPPIAQFHKLTCAIPI